MLQDTNPQGEEPPAGQDPEHSLAETSAAETTFLTQPDPELPGPGTGSLEAHEGGRDTASQPSPQREQTLWKLR